jgi:hypothetical protein
METEKGDPEKIANLCKQVLKNHFGNMVAKCDIKWRPMGENQAKGNLKEAKISKMEMDRPHIKARWWKCSKESPQVEPKRRKKERKTQDYMVKQSEYRSRTWREEMAAEIKSLSKYRIQWQTFIKALCFSKGWKDILLLLHITVSPKLFLTYSLLP